MVNSQLQFQVGLTNWSGETKAVNIYVVIVNEGIFEISEGSATNNVGVVDSEEVLRTRLTGANVDKTRTNAGLTGGGLWDDFKSLVSGAKDVISTGEDVYGVGKKVFDTGKKMMGKGAVGGGLVGGKMMTKQQLKALLA